MEKLKLNTYHRIGVSEDQRYFAVMTPGKTVILESGSNQVVIVLPVQYASYCTFSKDKDRIAIRNTTGTIYFFDMNGHKLWRSLATRDAGRDMFFVNHESLLLSSDLSGKIFTLDTTDGTFYQLAYVESEMGLATIIYDGRSYYLLRHFYYKQSKVLKTRFYEVSHNFRAISAEPTLELPLDANLCTARMQNKLLISEMSEANFYTLDVRTGEMQPYYSGNFPVRSFYNFEIDKSGRYLVVASMHMVYLVDLATGNTMKQLSVEDVSGSRFVNDNLVVGTPNGTFIYSFEELGL